MFRILTGALTAALLTTGAAHAARMSYDFWLYDEISGNLITDDGVLSYEASLGLPFLSGSDISLSFSVTEPWGTASYTEANSATSPIFAFSGTELSAIIGYALIDTVNGVDFTNYDFSGAWFSDLSFVDDAEGGHYAINVETNAPTSVLPAVPLPAGAPLVASAFGAFAFLRRKKKKAA